MLTKHLNTAYPILITSKLKEISDKMQTSIKNEINYCLMYLVTYLDG